MADLTRRHQAIHRYTAADELAEIITGERGTQQRWLTSLADASSQVRVLNQASSRTESLLPRQATLDVLRRGIALRVVHDESAVGSPAAIARHRTGIAAGEQARVAGDVSVHMLLVDDRLALMPLGRDQLCSDGLLVVHPCALLDALSALFELVWAGGVSLSLEPATQPSGQPPVLANPTTRTVLSLLSVGLTDQAIARRLGCSARTVQRHVLRLTEATGARTRFQAALHIGHHGWI